MPDLCQKPETCQDCGGPVYQGQGHACGHLWPPDGQESVSNVHVGYIAGRHVRCGACEGQYAVSTSGWLYRVNVGYYGQTCHECGDTLVKPATEAWPELFTRRDCQTCQSTRYDYDVQAWVVNGRYVPCGHPDEMDCQCHGKVHAGELA